MAINFQLVSRPGREQKTSVLAVPFSKALPATVRKALAERGWKNGWGAAELLLEKSGFVGVLGLGEEKATKRAEGLRRALAKLLLGMRSQALRELTLDLREEEGALQLLSAAVEAAQLTNYAFTEHKKTLAAQQRRQALKRLTIILPKASLPEAKKKLRETQRIMVGVELARNLVSEPASHMKPSTLKEVAEALAKHEAVSVRVMNRDEAAVDGWSAFLAVAAGSSEEPYVIHLKYTPRQSRKALRATGLVPRPRKVVLVGKGVTFDSGGLSLKPADAMEDMKIDMAGAATVLGVFSALLTSDVPVEVHGVIAACENMPSGSAYRPGDVVAARSGKTIEIGNTDAEGRVTLADALDYAKELVPDAIIDLATLTGAVIVALGETYAGLFSNNQGLNDALLTAAERAGEGLEDLPMPEEYKSHVESKVADLTNAPANHPYGGAVTAAMFLREFVGDTAWAHIDLAGPSYLSKPLIPYWAGGATGYGVRTLIEFLRKF